MDSLYYMGLSESILKHTITCCENICDVVDFEIDSGCCKTHYSNSSPKRTKSKESNNNENENDNESVISQK